MQNIEKTYFSRYYFFASFDFYNSQEIIFPKLWLNIWLYYSCCMATSLFPQMSSPVWLTEYPLHWVIYPCAVQLVNLSLSHVHRQDTMPPIVQPLQSQLNVGHEHSTAKTFFLLMFILLKPCQLMGRLYAPVGICFLNCVERLKTIMTKEWVKDTLKHS